MGAESTVKAAVVYDVSQMKEGVAETIEGLQEMAEQATVTSTTMMSKSQAMAAAAQEAATKVTVGDLEMAKSARALTEAKAAQAKMSRDVKLGLVDETAGLVLQAEAIATTRSAQLQLVTSQKAVAAEAVAAAEAANLSSIGWVAAFQRIALSARESLGAVEEKLIETAETAKVSSGGISGGFAALGGLMSAAIGVGFAAHFLDETAKMEVELDHLSAKTGIAVGDLSGLQLIVKEMGGDFEPVALGLVKMEKAQAGAAAQAGPLRNAFHAIGISLGEVKSLNAEQMLQRISEGFEQHNNHALQAAVAIALFGRGGQALIPILREQGSALDENIKKAAATTGVTNDSVEAARRWTAAMADLSAQAQHVMLPVLEHVMDVVRGIWGVFEIAAAIIVSAAELIIRSIEGIARATVPTLKLLWDLQTMNFSGAKKDIEDFKNAFVDSFSKGFEQVKSGWAEAIGQFTGHKPIPVPKMEAAAEDPLGDGIGPTGKPKKVKEDTSTKDMIRRAEEDAETNKRIHEALTETFEADVHRQEEVQRQADRAQHESTEQFKKEQAEKIQAIGEVAQAAIATASENAAMEEEAVSARLAEGTITKLGAAKQLAAIHTAEYTVKLKALKDELDALSDGHGGSIDPKKSDQVQNEVTKTQGQQTVAQGKDTAAQTTAISAPYLAAFTQINNGWLKVQNDLLAGNKNIGQDFRRWGLQMVQDAAKNAEEMLVKYARMEIQKAVAHRATVAANNATDAAGAATSDGISLLSAIKQMGHNASVAAGKAYAAMAGIPPAPVFGVIAGALAYAGVMALAAFDKGGVVGGYGSMEVPILAKPGERVLSNSQTTNFERMVNNSSTGGSTMNNYFGNNRYSGSGGGDFKSQWAANEKHIGTSLKRMHREGKLRMA